MIIEETVDDDNNDAIVAKDELWCKFNNIL